jgi:hypothetical protein
MVSVHQIDAVHSVAHERTLKSTQTFGSSYKNMTDSIETCNETSLYGMNTRVASLLFWVQTLAPPPVS